ncbi:HPP family-domain-containing protein [Xylariales sp. PMI_506]|nr:HPP family-domain-containing protein [Xylariales sp. PMI_506]
MPLPELSKWHFNVDRYLNPWLPRPPWRYLPSVVTHFLGHRPSSKGHGSSTRPMGNLVIIFWAFIGIFCGLAIIEVVGHAIPSFQERDAPIIIGSFGAAAVLEFYAIESPLSQPRNAVLGQMLASLVGISVRKLFDLGGGSIDSSGNSNSHLLWLAGSASCAAATAVMALTGTVHPPAGATALLAVVDEQVAGLGWFLLVVVLLGCVLMQAVALVVNNLAGLAAPSSSGRRFPAYWWTPEEVGHGWKRGLRNKRREKKNIGGGRGDGSDADAEKGGTEQSKQAAAAGGLDASSVANIISRSGDDSDSESAAKIETYSLHHVEEAGGGVGSGRVAQSEAGEAHIFIRKGHVLIPEGVYMTTEEILLLEALSNRL